MKTTRNITILGSTGSIGQNTLAIIKQYPLRFRVFSLSASSNASLLYHQCRLYKPRYAVLTNPAKASIFKKLQRSHPIPTQLLEGEDELAFIASHQDVDTVMSAISSSAGLVPTMAAVEAGKKILLANKEALVMSGPLLIKAAQKKDAAIIPVDSEHNAIFQCLPQGYQCGRKPNNVEKIILTASGGPFRRLSLEAFDTITIDEALAHPNWKMGKKISIDSATMMNKALEVIEAHYLFNFPPEKIDVIIHPESIIHSCVQYQDSSILAQMGCSDMRIPIVYALFHPNRAPQPVKNLDFHQLKSLHFEPVDHQRFPLLKLAYEAIIKGGTAPTILNAANEIAVEAFLSNKIKFTDIGTCVAKVFHQIKHSSVKNLDNLLTMHQHVQDITRKICQSISN